MTRSTGKFISYDLRPAKQSERGMMLSLIRLGAELGFSIDNYRYVGMGANRFYDFLMLHKYLGIRDMVSLEHDPNMFKRAEFNVPFNFIKVLEEDAASFISTDENAVPTIFWLDYDSGIDRSIISDLTALALRFKKGDYCFVTAAGGPPEVIQSAGATKRLEWLQDAFGDYAGTVLIDDVQNSSFFVAVRKIISAAYKDAFATRTDGSFSQLFNVKYSDSMPMVTVGGCFLSSVQVADYKARVSTAMPFLPVHSDEAYNIKSLNITDRERHIFDRAVTAKRKRSKEMNLLKGLGFKERDFSDYQDLLRFMPRYIEAIF